MSPENTHKLMGFYMEVIIILGVNTLYVLFCFFKLFLIGCIGLSFQLVLLFLGYNVSLPFQLEV